MTSRGVIAAALRRIGAAKRTMYRGGRPNGLMRLWNRVDALVYARGWVGPTSTAALKVSGRRSGRAVAVPVAVTGVGGAEYLVSMLGPDAGWVRNVEAAGGNAVLRRRGHDVPVLLETVPARDRASILRRYVAIAPGARPHLGLGPAAPLAEFARISDAHPVYRIRRR